MPENASSYQDQIGETAGLVWHLLKSDGAHTLAKLSKSIDAPPNVVMHAIGWLAREGKIDFEENGRTRLVSLR